MPSWAGSETGIDLYSREKKLWHIRRMGSSVVYEALERRETNSLLLLEEWGRRITKEWI